MKSDDKTKEQLLKEIDLLKAKIGELEKSEIDRKQVEEALQESEEKYRANYDNIPLSYQSLDEDGCFIEVNPAWLRTLGYKKEEVIGKWFGDFLHPDWKPHFEKNFPEFKKRGYVHDVQFKIRHKDGHYLDISFEGRIGYTLDGKFKETYCVFQDITERKRTAEALKESKALLQTLVDTSPDLIWIKDSNGVYLTCNIRVESLFGKTASEICGKTDYDFVDKELADFFRQKDKEAIAAGKPTMNEEEIVFADEGHREILETIKTPLYDSQGHLIGVLGFARDITARKQMEEQLKKSLKEKEILIKEIYHRVKNNLAVVSGLLNIQAANIKDKKVKAAFQATRDRIFSLSAVHSQLYHSENYSYVDYKEYIKKLVSNVFYSSQMSGHVKLHLDLADISLPIDKAIPCGLLLNEIVTNALKHAFPENRKGNLRIIAHSLEDKKCEIIVKDDGIGIPESFNIEKTKTLGLKLIDLMAKQIEGTLEIESKKGTEFRIRLSTESGQVIR